MMDLWGHMIYQWPDSPEYYASTIFNVFANRLSSLLHVYVHVYHHNNVYRYTCTCMHMYIKNWLAWHHNGGQVLNTNSAWNKV